jgi:acid phosphatase
MDAGTMLDSASKTTCISCPYGDESGARNTNDFCGSPFVSFESITHNGSRLLNIQSFQEYQTDFAAKKVPQFAFMVPNMMNSGYNTTLEYSMKWAHEFITPMLVDRVFKERTLILLTFDASESYGKPNHIGGLLIGSAVPRWLRGTSDNTFYTHYSILSTMQFNWEMPNLGRYDVGANIYQYVQDLGSRVLVPNQDPPNIDTLDNSISYTGAFHNSSAYLPIPPPNLNLNGSSGLSILEDVKFAWQKTIRDPTPYDGTGAVYDGANPPPYLPQHPE